MNRSQLFLAIVLTLASPFAACSSNSTPSVAPTPGFPPGGSTRTYVSSEWGVSMPAHGTPAPIPTRTFSETETIRGGADFHGRTGLIDVRHSRKNASGASETDDYLSWAQMATGDQTLQRIAATSSENATSGPFRVVDSGETVYDPPATVVEFPFATQNRWNAAISYHAHSFGKVTYKDMTIPTGGRTTWNRNGSYSTQSLNAVVVLVDGRRQPNQRSTESVASDGSAQVEVTERAKTLLRMTIGVPKQSGSKYVIPVTSNGASFTINDWYPGGGLPPSPLVRATAVDKGATALPASCNVSRSIAPTAEEIVVTQSQLNPFGIVARGTDTSYYSPKIGMVCEITVGNDTVYDFRPPRAVLAGRTTTYVVTALAKTTYRGVPLPPVELSDTLRESELRDATCRADSLFDASTILSATCWNQF